jgi:hypothetical protein
MPIIVVLVGQEMVSSMLTAEQKQHLQIGGQRMMMMIRFYVMM